jgi:hypothetical protein
MIKIRELPFNGQMRDYRTYLREATTIQTETIRRLIDNDSTPPLEVAAVLEDIANLYLDISDDIRDLALGRTTTSPKPATKPHEADDPA